MSSLIRCHHNAGESILFILGFYIFSLLFHLIGRERPVVEKCVQIGRRGVVFLCAAAVCWEVVFPYLNSGFCLCHRPAESFLRLSSVPLVSNMSSAILKTVVSVVRV